MSYSASSKIKERLEIDQLKSMSYESINELMNTLHSTAKKAEADFKMASQTCRDHQAEIDKLKQELAQSKLQTARLIKGIQNLKEIFSDHELSLPYREADKLLEKHKATK